MTDLEKRVKSLKQKRGHALARLNETYVCYQDAELRYADITNELKEAERELEEARKMNQKTP